MLRRGLFLGITLSLAAAGSGCTDGILIVGGRTAAGPSRDIHLLSGDWQWCSRSGFPELPHPVANPGACFFRGKLFVCGFPGENSCKYTERGWAEWIDLYGLANQTDFKMACLSKDDPNFRGRHVLMISKDRDDEGDLNNHLQFNPVEYMGRYHDILTSWWTRGSPFNLDRDLQDASLSHFRGDLFVSGGLKEHSGRNYFTKESQGSVAKWSSVRHSEAWSFEDEVVPDMMEKREGHASTEFEEKLVVSGGYRQDLNFASRGSKLESYQRQKSAEYFDGVDWKSMPSMKQERAHFGLESMCGALVALGGMQNEGPHSDDKFLSSVEVTRSVESEWSEQLGLELPEGRGYFATVPVYDMQCE